MRYETHQMRPSVVDPTRLFLALLLSLLQSTLPTTLAKAAMPRTCLACLSRRLSSMQLEGSSLGQRSYSAVPKPPRTHDSTSLKPPRSETRTRSSTRKPEGRSTKPPSFGLRRETKHEMTPITIDVQRPVARGPGEGFAGPSRPTSDRMVKQPKSLYPPPQSTPPPAIDFSALPPHPSPRSRVGLQPRSPSTSRFN